MKLLLRCLTLILALLAVCPAATAEARRYTALEADALSSRFAALTPAPTLKAIGYDAPVMTQRLGADPWALVDGDRVYLYMTADVVERGADGAAKQNSYSKINRLNVVSSSDLINWTDHGSIAAAGYTGAAKWGGNSWAPAVAAKEIDGRKQYFVYFANGGNGIGVLRGDSPTGPFTDPLGHALVSRATPGCADVTWLFDPAVLVDEDGSAYLYFGGGIPSGREADPGTARVVRLGDDMISLAGDPQPLAVPYLFEDSGINRIGDTYYYSYCTNWSVSPAARRSYGFDSAQIVYMTSSSPMGPFTPGGVVLKNPGSYYGCYGNNHHCIFSFRGEWYIAYHTQLLEKPMGISGGYRATSVSRITVREDGSIPTLQVIRRDSLPQAGCFDPYTTVSAATMATMGGVTTVPAEEGVSCGDMVLSGIHDGSWVALRGVDFGAGASSFTATIRTRACAGAIQLRLDSLSGDIIGYLDWDGSCEGTQTLTACLTGAVEGVHDLVMVFAGEGYQAESWRFTE